MYTLHITSISYSPTDLAVTSPTEGFLCAATTCQDHALSQENGVRLDKMYGPSNLPSMKIIAKDPTTTMFLHLTKSQAIIFRQTNKH